MTLTQAFVGIDVSRLHLDVFVEGNSRSIRIDNEATAIDALLATLGDRPTTFVFEATGPYDMALRRAIEGASGLSAMRINPARARDFARAAGYLAKTDAVDARMLAALGRAIAAPLAEPVDPEREKLSALTRQRDHLVTVRADQKKRRQQCSDPEIAASIERHIAFLTGEVRAMEREIETLVEASSSLAEAKKILISAPGVGDVTASTLLAQMPELGRRSPKTIAALAGLAPLNNDSGERRGRRAIRGGRRHVRRVLYMAALSAIRKVPRFAATYQAIAKRSQSPKVAIIAVARKLLIALNAMLANQQPFRA